MSTTTEKFVVYWLGYHSYSLRHSVASQGIDVVNLFLLNLTTSPNGTTLDYNYITSNGTTGHDPSLKRRRLRRTE